MLQFLILLGVIFGLTIVIGTPILIFRGYTKLKLKGHRKIANFLLLLCVAIAAGISYAVIGEIYPYDDWYKENFKMELGVGFPENGKIIYKDASYPDIHGHFISACSFAVSQETFNQLLNTLPPNSAYCNIRSAEIDHVMDHYNQKEIKHVYKKIDGDSSIYLMFLSDNKTILYFFFCEIPTGC